MPRTITIEGRDELYYAHQLMVNVITNIDKVITANIKTHG